MEPTIGAGSLGEFLSAARTRLSPDVLGVSVTNERRRVTGLRREEIAMLAGVSPSYYARLEQGQALNASEQVINALARGLRLEPAEAAHLHELARAESRSQEPDADAGADVEETLQPELLELLDNLGDVPALVLGSRRDILGWNRLGHALFAGHLDVDSVADPARRPNATEMIFLDPHTRELYTDWEEKATASVGHLRLLAARQPNDRRLLELIGGLTARSDDFTRLWALNRIRTTLTAHYRLSHPVVGEMLVTQQLLAVPDPASTTVVICTAERDSSSQSALRLLAHAVHESRS